MLFQQLVNRMCSHCLFPAYSQVVSGLLATCYKVAELNRLVTYKLFQQLVVVLQFNNLSTSCEWQPCSNFILQQHCCNLLTSLLHNYNTRYKDNLRPPKVSRNWGKKRLAYQAVTDWNNLDRNIKLSVVFLHLGETFFSNFWTFPRIFLKYFS
jgi:hypothetical protein